MRRLALAIALAFVVTAPAAGASKPVVLWESYTGSPAGVYCAGVLQPDDCPSISGSAVQFGPFSAARADIEVRDDSSRVVGASFTFYDPDGAPLSDGWLCYGTYGLHVPDGAAYLVVKVDNPTTKQHCSLASAGVSGYVMVRLRGSE